MSEIKYVEKPKSVQTSVTHSDWIKKIRGVAKGYVKTPGGEGVSNNDFFVIAAGIYATKILKDVGIYDTIKANYEAQYGPIQEYGADQEEDSNDTQGVTADPLYDES